MAKQDDENILSRWSRRKLAAKEQAASEASADTPQETRGPDSAAEDPALEQELQANREAAEAVDLATINEKTDMSVFLKAGVPAALRNKALATLWRSNPVYACLDGLNDYDDDYSAPGLIMKTYKSAWQIGRGYLDAVAPPEKTASAESPAEAEEEAARTSPDEPAGPSQTEAEQPEIEAAHMEAAPEDPPQAEFDAEPLPRVPLRRRLALDSGT